MKEEIKIYRDGKTVVAVDARNNHTASATCSPNDSFDFMTGAKIALDRLEEMQCPFKVGDVVIGLNTTEHPPYYPITGQKAISKVVAVSSETEIRVKLLRPKSPNHVSFIDEEWVIDARTVKKWEGFDVGDIVAPIRNEDRFGDFRTAIITEIGKENGGAKAILKTQQNPSQYCCRDVATIRYATEDEEREFKKRFNESEFRVGDVVKVVDTGACYSYYYDWVIEHITEKAQIARFAYGTGMGYPERKSIDKPFIVLYVTDSIAYISEDDIRNPCYVIGKRGLEHYPTR